MKTRRRMLENEDPYRVLGLSRDATDEQIRAAYFARVKEASPERDPDRFQAVRRAYDRLRDPEKRKLAEITTYREDVDIDVGELLGCLEHVPPPPELRPLVRRAIALHWIEQEKQKLAAELAAALPPDLDAAKKKAPARTKKASTRKKAAKGKKASARKKAPPKKGPARKKGPS